VPQESLVRLRAQNKKKTLLLPILSIKVSLFPLFYLDFCGVFCQNNIVFKKVELGAGGVAQVIQCLPSKV
jgi:hypothetical protein